MIAHSHPIPTLVRSTGANRTTVDCGMTKVVPPGDASESAPDLVTVTDPPDAISVNVRPPGRLEADGKVTAPPAAISTLVCVVADKVPETFSVVVVGS